MRVILGDPEEIKTGEEEEPLREFWTYVRITEGPPIISGTQGQGGYVTVTEHVLIRETSTIEFNDGTVWDKETIEAWEKLGVNRH